MSHSLAALCIGFFLDLLAGDPHSFPHVIRLVGRLISVAEKSVRALFPPTASGERAGGAVAVCAVLILSVPVPALTLRALYGLGRFWGLAAESLLCWQLLAVRSLRDESLSVYTALQAGDLEGARERLSMIVGRDTQNLDESGVVRAAVETVAENTSDGCVAPLFYMALGGVLGGCFCKAVNTMDSMLGYKNERYLNFGRCAALFDDAVNFLPARLAGVLMTAAAAVTGMNWKNAWLIFRRDRLCHASPNSAHTEAAAAGALGVQLGGANSYGGVLCVKPTIGDALRPLEAEDIRRAHKLMYAASALAFLGACACRAALS